ncbi:uncharacterized protein STEHIDRAFT_159184 [Stereum hirsutum FP-91666 SS1]|uniref:uncharacterized protein n=1 Tax=Stereum hirsutum (strain FP-91666) TaxID=721885 RepID=UPI000444A6EF|nr:uncharacterized protein STEHIDRAFT_159184 [Stereum hirsutum FP-91666 SS1]EIM84513.1 hypothetical protein STEHIDRAFT_159184 [Stereum hirsutum FP-91666 SS1]
MEISQRFPFSTYTKDSSAEAVAVNNGHVFSHCANNGFLGDTSTSFTQKDPKLEGPSLFSPSSTAPTATTLSAQPSTGTNISDSSVISPCTLALSSPTSLNPLFTTFATSNAPKTPLVPSTPTPTSNSSHFTVITSVSAGVASATPDSPAIPDLRNHSRLNNGAIAAIVIGSIAFVWLILGALYFLRLKQTRHNDGSLTDVTRFIRASREDDSTVEFSDVGTHGAHLAGRPLLEPHSMQVGESSQIRSTEIIRPGATSRDALLKIIPERRSQPSFLDMSSPVEKDALAQSVPSPSSYRTSFLEMLRVFQHRTNNV